LGFAGHGGGRDDGQGGGDAAVHGGSFGNSFVRPTVVGRAGVGVAGIRGSRLSNGGSNTGYRNGGLRHGFHRNRFFDGGFRFGFWPYYDDYYPYSAAADYYYDNGCYVVERRLLTRYGSAGAGVRVIRIAQGQFITTFRTIFLRCSNTSASGETPPFG
jgi:hypothetical protein